MQRLRSAGLRSPKVAERRRRPVGAAAATLLWAGLLLLLASWPYPPPVPAAAAEEPGDAGQAGERSAPAPAELVYVVPVNGNVEHGLARFIRRAIGEAEAAGADLVVVEIDTPGGRLDSVLEIRRDLVGSPVPTATYVEHRAWSAGALIALSTQHLYMAPDASIGAAEPRPPDEKTISAVRAEFEATARRHGRDPQVAAAMVDASVEIEGVVEEGHILTLTADRALEIGFIDGVAANRTELLAALGAADARVVVVEPRGAERFARFITDPVVAPILLAVGFMGLVAELLLPGFGFPGLVGIAALALYFGGHMLAGLTGWEVVILFLVGVVLLAVEVFMPGFGVFGIAGLGAMLLSVFLTAPSAADAVRSLFAAVGTSLILGFILVRYAGARGLWSRLALGERLSGEQGYVAPSYPRELVGRTGRAVTTLRPAGTAVIDGRRWDVVTEGSFIKAGSLVRVIAVEGVRIVVTEAEPGEATTASPAGEE
ncbi:MAG TPA: nodulation protein NfeD [Bacillota bacterium]